ncbi:MAG: hypothetical protein AAF601_08585 [Pseudomonadota bacterium]
MAKSRRFGQQNGFGADTDNGDASNPFIDLTDETALLAAAYLVEIAALNLAARLLPEDTAELIDVSARLSAVVARLPGGLTETLKRH